MSSVLLRPVRWIARRRVALVLHVVVLLGVRRVGWVGRTRRGYGWIYRYIGVRFYMWRVMMVILVSILQGHGRTCCLSHTPSIGVAVLLSVMLTRQVFRVQVGWTRRRWVDAELRSRSRCCWEVARPHFLMWCVLRSRCWIYGSFLGSSLEGQRRMWTCVQTWLRVLVGCPSVHQMLQLPLSALVQSFTSNIDCTHCFTTPKRLSGLSR